MHFKCLVLLRSFREKLLNLQFGIQEYVLYSLTD